MYDDKNSKLPSERDEFASAFVEVAFSNVEIEQAVKLEKQLGLRGGGPEDGCEFLHRLVEKPISAYSK